MHNIALLLHHKVFVGYHKNVLVIAANLLADGLFKKTCFVVRIV